MLFNLNEEDTTSAIDNVDIDGLTNKDDNTEEGITNIAKEVDNNMQAAALEGVTYFDGGEQALKEFCNDETTLALTESRKMAKKTIMRIGKNDDLTRRANLASLILAREHKDPLFTKLALNRVKERQLRKAIFSKYGNKAMRIAKVSQREHVKAMRKMPALPTIKFN